MEEKMGEYIKKLRIDQGLTLTKLAAALDIDQSTLSKIENQKRKVPKEILPKLAQVFGLDLRKIEIEFFSERIAEIIVEVEDEAEILTLALKKANSYKFSIERIKRQ